MSTAPAVPELDARVAELADELTISAVCFLEQLDDLATVATETAELDARYRAALTKIGARDRRPPMKELLVEVLHASLEAFRPALPFVATTSAARSAEAATGAPQIVGPTARE